MTYDCNASYFCYVIVYTCSIALHEWMKLKARVSHIDLLIILIVAVILVTKHDIPPTFLMGESLPSYQLITS